MIELILVPSELIFELFFYTTCLAMHVSHAVLYVSLFVCMVRSYLSMCVGGSFQHSWSSVKLKYHAFHCPSYIARNEKIIPKW